LKPTAAGPTVDVLDACSKLPAPSKQKQGSVKLVLCELSPPLLLQRRRRRRRRQPMNSRGQL